MTGLVKHSRLALVILGAAIALTVLIATLPVIGIAPIKSDASLSTYAAQQIASGQAPYANYIIMHPPVPHLLGALVIVIGRQFGVSDVLSIRILCLLLTLIISWVAYWIGEEFRPGLGLLSAAAASLNLLMLMSVWGMLVKLVMLLFFALMLLCLMRRAWLASGIFLGLAVFSWSGAILFILPVAAIILLGSRRSENTRWKILPGFFSVVAVVGLILGVSGTLKDFLNQYALTFWQYAVNKFTGQGVQDPGIGLGNIFQSGELSRVDMFVLLLGAVGLLVYSFRRKKVIVAHLPTAVIVFTATLGVLMVLADYQSPFDLLPLIPPFAVGFAWLAANGISQWIRIWKTEETHVYEIALILMLCFVRLSGLSEVPDRLPAQMEAAEWISRSGAPSYSIQAVGDLSILVLADLQNALPVIHAGPKTYLAMKNLGWSIEHFVGRLGADRPGIILVDNRNAKKDYLTPFSFFLTKEYIYIGSTTEPNLNIYADAGQPEAVRDAIGLALLLGDGTLTSTVPNSALGLDQLAAVSELETYLLDEFHFIFSHDYGEDLALYWWSQQDTPAMGRIAVQWVTEGEEPSTDWAISPVSWQPGYASLSYHAIPKRPGENSQLVLCIAAQDVPGNAIRCLGAVVVIVP